MVTHVVVGFGMKAKLCKTNVVERNTLRYSDSCIVSTHETSPRHLSDKLTEDVSNQPLELNKALGTEVRCAYTSVEKQILLLTPKVRYLDIWWKSP